MSDIQVVLTFPRTNQRISQQQLLVQSSKLDASFEALVDPPQGGGLTKISDVTAYDSGPKVFTRTIKLRPSADFAAFWPTDADKIYTVSQLDPTSPTPLGIKSIFDGDAGTIAIQGNVTSVTTVV